MEERVSLVPGASCLQRDRLVPRIARWLQRDELELDLRIHVRGDPQVATRVFFAVTRQPGRQAERRIDNAPAECDQLHSAVALSIALAIEATLQQRAAGASAIAEVPESPPAWKRPAAASPMHLELAILGGASIGVVTDASLAAAPRLAFTPLPWLQLAISGLLVRLEGEAVPDVAGTFDSTLWAAGLDACFGGEASQGLGFYMCAGARGGQFRTAGQGFDRKNLTSSSPWWALAGSGQGRFWLSRVIAIGTSIEALYALAERSIAVFGPTGQVDRARRVPRVGLTVTVGPVFRFF